VCVCVCVCVEVEDEYVSDIYFILYILYIDIYSNKYTYVYNT